MAGNSFGRVFRITTSGESHGPGLGVIIDGCPPGLEIDAQYIQTQLDRRKPGQSHVTTQRKENDTITLHSGIYEGRTTGAPILILIPNEDVRPADYDHLETAFRPSHADYTYFKKYGVRDHRGGGRSSARETANWVAAGAIAKLLLQKEGIRVHAAVTQIGSIITSLKPEELDWTYAESNIVRCPDREVAQAMIVLVETIKSEGDTIGGVITCVIEGCPPGLGEPVFHKLDADLSQAIMSINACKGFEYGAGFSSAYAKGSEQNDIFEKDGEVVVTKTNHSGGIQGGITNGMPVYFRAAFKPVSTIQKSQETITSSGNEITIEGKGRHDPCVVPRAVPIVEAMAALVIADHLLLHRIYSVNGEK
jgi:chorismate synthase